MPRPLAMVALTVSGLFASATPTASGETITVCPEGCDHVLVNPAIAAASDGDVILIDVDGQHQELEPIVTQGKAITIRGRVDEYGFLLTTLDGGNDHRIMLCEGPAGQATPHVVVEHLNFERGICDGPGQGYAGGGAILVGGDGLPNVQVTIRSCSFRYNRSTILTLAGVVSPVVENCLFVSNQSCNDRVFRHEAGIGRIEDCVFRDNDGQALSVFNGGPTTIRNCDFTSNRSNVVLFLRNCKSVIGCTFEANEPPDGRDGVSIEVEGGIPEIAACEFVSNAGRGRAAAIKVRTYAATAVPYIHSCIFRDNELSDLDPSQAQGVIWLDATSSLRLRNNSFCYNTPPDVQGAYQDEGGNFFCGSGPDDDCDADADGDGISNCFEYCPNDPTKTEPGDCGCGEPETDTDRDGTPDCLDGCPGDPLKTEPGVCGCGVADIDTDGDGIFDCEEEEIGTDPNLADTDGDGMNDSVDELPLDADHATPEIDVLPGRSINTPIAAAEQDAVIQLSNGVYFEGSVIDTLGKAITIRGEVHADGTSATTLHGGGAHRVLRHDGAAGEGDLILEDLIIRMGADAPDSGGGAGVHVRNGSAILRRCRLEENVAAGLGGGLFVESATVEVAECILKGNQARYGGGLCLENGSAVLADCTVKENQAVDGRGGGVYAWDYGNSPDASLTLTDCTLKDNTSVEVGGGASVENMSVTLDNCSLESNTAQTGGGLFIDPSDPDGSTVATVTHCNFTGNSAEFGAGFGTGGAGTLRIDYCQFTDNDAQYGGGIAIEYDSSPTVFTCTFENNSAVEGGGVLCAIGSSPTIDTCDLLENHSSGNGGGMGIWNEGETSQPTVRDCNFVGNTAANFGGGVYHLNSGGSPELNGCLFISNQALAGGGVYLDSQSTANLIDCEFVSNSATGENGGGLAMTGEGTNPTLDTCTFTTNSAANHGGGICNFDGSPSLSDCVFTGNTAGTHGGGMYNEGFGSPTLAGCVFTGNDAGVAGGGLSSLLGSPTVTDSIFCENRAGGTATETNQISGDYTDGGGNCITLVCDSDTDEDGILDCDDNCPTDPNKTEPGECGCGVADTDTDGDGIPDCTDQYPNDWDNDGVEDEDDLIFDLAPGTPGQVNEAIGRAAENNVIQFAAGTYAEGAPIDTLGKTLTFRGVVDVDGAPASILDGGGVHQVLAATDGGVPVTVRFENLIIRHGLAEAGGGMRLAGDGHTYEIVNCSIESNQAQNAGGGVFLAAGASAELANTTVWGNAAGTGGGGMHVAGSPRLELVDSRFGYNTAGTAGGGLEVDDPTGVSSKFSILTSSFTHNEAPIGAGLRLASQEGTAPSISYTTIAANQVGEGLVVEGAWTGNLPVAACDINANAREGVANLQSAGIVLVDRTTICGNGGSGQVAGSVFESAGGASCISDTCDADGDNQADCGPGDGFTGFFGDDPDGLLDPFFVNGLDAWLSFNRVFALAGVDPLGTALPAGFETTVLLSGSSWGSVNDNGVAQDICWSPGAPITFGADAVIRPGDRFQGMSAESPRVESTTEAYAALEVYRTTETGDDVLWYAVKTDSITGANLTPGVIRTLSGTLTIPPEDADQVSRVAYVIELQQQADFDTGRILFTNAFVETECGSCVGDVNGDGMVDAADLGLLISAWGTADPNADINGDGDVDAADLGLLVAAWGLCP